MPINALSHIQVSELVAVDPQTPTSPTTTTCLKKQAAVQGDPYQAQLPLLLAAEQVEGTTKLTVDLNSTVGPPAAVHLMQSSGYKGMDFASMTSAARTTFSPEYLDCKPIAASYYISLEWDGNYY